MIRATRVEGDEVLLILKLKRQKDLRMDKRNLQRRWTFKKLFSEDTSKIQ